MSSVSSTPGEDEGVMILATQADADTPPAAWTRVHVGGPTSLACGHFHYIAVGTSGVYSWGRGPLGVLGHGGEDDEPRPRLIEALQGEPIESVSAGPYHSAGVTSDGRLYMWGWMPFAPTGDGGMEETFSRVPRLISLDAAVRVVGVACGCFGTAAWDSRGQLYTWGRSSSGQLGHGTDTTVASPRPVEALAGVRVAQVAFGGVQTADENTGFMLVRSEAGVVFSCGSSKRGRLGRPFSTDEIALTEDGMDEPVHHGVPGEVMLGNDAALAATVAAADNHAVALSFDGVAYIWGANDAGLLGLDMDAPDASTPLEVTELPPLAHVVCTAYSSAFLAHTGELLLLGGDPDVIRPRLAGLPGHIGRIFGGGHHLGVMLRGLKPGGAQAGGAQMAKPALLRDAAFNETVDPEIAELLMADPKGSTPLQLRHELRLLRDLMAAERAKLHQIQHGTPLVSEAAQQAAEASPSGGTWTEQMGVRQPTSKKETNYTVALDMERSTGGMMYVAKESLLMPHHDNLKERKEKRAAVGAT